MPKVKALMPCTGKQREATDRCLGLVETCCFLTGNACGCPFSLEFFNGIFFAFFFGFK